MDACYKTLSTIFDIVKADPAPHTYPVTPREIILRQTVDWTAIEQHLQSLESEKLVTLKQLDKLTITITPTGIAKAKALRNNFLNNSFSFSREKQASGINSEPREV